MSEPMTDAQIRGAVSDLEQEANAIKREQEALATRSGRLADRAARVWAELRDR